MFKALIPPYSWICAILLGGWLGAYILGLWRGEDNSDRSRRLARPAKLTMITIVLAYGVIWLRLAANTDAGDYALMIMLGLAAGAAGDLVLSDLVPVRKPIIAAMGVFGAGHVMYIIAIFMARKLVGIHGVVAPIIAVIISAGISAGAWTLFVRNPRSSKVLNVGALLYGMLLGAAAALAVGLSVQSGEMLILAAGLALFFISDLMLAQVLIRGKGFLYIRDVVWIIYSAAQVLIAFSIGSAIAVL